MGCSGSSNAKDPSKGGASAPSANSGAQDKTVGPSTGAAKTDLVPLPIHAPSAPQINEGASASPKSKGSRYDANGRRIKSSRSEPANFFKGAYYNGFKVMPEAPAIVVTESGMAPYSLCAEALSFEPPDECIISRFKNGDQERKIHCNIRLAELEVERLRDMRGEARAQGVEFYPSVTSMGTRFLSRARMDPKKAVRLMRETQDWRASFFKDGPIDEKEVLEDMKHGIVYFSGRDHALRPCIVIRAARIPQEWYKEKRIDKFIRLLIFCMEYFLRYMVVPGKVENLSVLVDLHSLGISQVPVAALKDVYQVMSHHYIGRVFKFYVCNVSIMLRTIAGLGVSLLTDRQKQKLIMVDDVKSLRSDFALTQLEEDLGGQRKKIKEFYPFPMRPGPFTPGYTGEPDADAVTGVHEVLTHQGSMGRLWEKGLSSEDNLRHDYGPKAVDILKACNLHVPPELLVVTDPEATGQEEDEDEEESLEEITEDELHVVDDGELGLEAEGRHPEIENTSICGGGLMCCRM